MITFNGDRNEPWVYLGVYKPVGHAGVDQVSRGILALAQLDLKFFKWPGNSKATKILRSWCLVGHYLTARYKKKLVVLDLNSHLAFYVPLYLCLVASRPFAGTNESLCLAHNLDSSLRKHYTWWARKLHKKFEESLLAQFEAVGFLSNYEASETCLRLKVPTFVYFPPLFTGITRSSRRSRRESKKGTLRLGFIAPGAFGPNIEAIEQIQRVASNNPDIQFHLRCDYSTPALVALENVKLIGSLTSIELDAFFDEIDVGLIPVQSGAGVKVKVLEMILRGVPILSTEHVTLGVPFLRSIQTSHLEDDLYWLRRAWAEEEVWESWLDTVQTDAELIRSYYGIDEKVFN